MNQNRRTMSQALQTAKLSEAALAFIHEGTARASVAPMTTVNGAERTEVPVATTIAPTDHKAASPPSNALGEPSPAPPVPSGPVSMTFRLPAEIPAGLIRASADRKLRRQPPCTQQDIVAEALTSWLNSPLKNAKKK